ncbi:sugar transferase, partial [Acinetobacter baumannii]
IVAAPVIAISAIAIRLDSPGPVFFRQPRLGLNNTIFPMFKLRTMTVDETDDGSRGTKRDNPRITRVGAFLRRTSLDEL